MSEKRIFTAAKPSGDLHLGNYLGAIKKWVDMQDDAMCFFNIADLHSITVWQDPSTLADRTRELAAGYIASGLDVKNNILYNQSLVKEHAELAWILNCVARVGWMNRMTQFKDKAGKNKEQVSLGLYAYPSLMAADILLYQATHVPVGEDQKQHVELTRDIANKFNNDFKTDLMVVPEPVMQKEGARIMSLRDGSKKMSKSDGSSAMGCIFMADSDEDIMKKFKKAKTDPDVLPSEIAGFENRAEALNLVTIYAKILNKSFEEVLPELAGMQFGVFKPMLADAVIAEISPIREEMKKLMQDKQYIDNILKDGADRARVIAQDFMKKVYEKVGFLQV